MRSKAQVTLLPVMLLCGFVIAAIFLTNLSRAQQVTSMEASRFRVQLETHPPPNEAVIKTLLEGKKAEPLSGGKILLIEPRVNRYTTNGVLEVQMRSPECIFDTMQRTVSSTNILQVEMAGGRLYTEGRGFLQTTNGILILSNQVHTVIRPDHRKISTP